MKAKNYGAYTKRCRQGAKKTMLKYKENLIGITVSVLIGVIALAFQPTSDQFVLPIQIILGSLTALVICSLIAIIILVVSWIFTKDSVFLGL